MKVADEILEDGNPLLRVPSAKWDPQKHSKEEIKGLINKMKKMMRESCGIGLAAPQVGVSLRIFVIESAGSERYTGLVNIPFSVFINPEIIKYDKKNSLFEEGCLSVPDCMVTLARPKSIIVSFIDQYFRPRKIKLKGLAARIFQHEYDHLDGILISDYLPEEWQKII